MTKPSQIKINDKIEKLESALERFEEALTVNQNSSILAIDGTIHRFEFCFELFWKTMKLILALEDTEAYSPRSTLQEALMFHWIEDEQLWYQMLEARNDTSHEYDEAKAQEFYNVLPSFLPAMQKTFAILKQKYYQPVSEIF